MGNFRVLLVSQWLLTTSSCILLLACGGGGGGGDSGPVEAPPSAQIISGGDEANRPPAIGGAPVEMITAGMNYRFSPNSSDPDGDALSFSIANKPSWANFNMSTGQLEGRPGTWNVGTYGSIRIEVSDGTTTTQLAAFTINVLGGATGGFTLSWHPPITNTDGSVLRDLAGYRIYLGRQSGNYSDVVEINNPGLTIYVFDQLAPGTYYVAITAVDRTGNESERSRELSTGV